MYLAHPYSDCISVRAITGPISRPPEECHDAAQCREIVLYKLREEDVARIRRHREEYGTTGADVSAGDLVHIVITCVFPMAYHPEAVYGVNGEGLLDDEVLWVISARVDELMLP